MHFMSSILFQVMKWTVSVFFAITGIYCLMVIQNTGDIKPLFISIVSFGIVYWMYKSKDDVPKAVMFMTLVVIVASYWIMLYAPYYLNLEHHLFTSSQYLAWLSCAFICGLPVAYITFWKTAD